MPPSDILINRCMRIFKNKTFNKWAKEEDIENDILLKVVEELQNGLFEANLGGCVYKKRISMDGKGKRGGARIIVAFKLNEITVFIYGFSKKQKGNITKKEEDALKELAKMYFSYSEEQLDEAVNAGKFIEVIP